MRHPAIFGLALALAALPLAAGDAWKKKPPAQWTPEEAVEVLTDSPWARRVNLWQLTGEAEQQTTTRRTTYQDAPGERPVSVPTEISTTTPQVAEAVYEVQWSSAGAPAQAWERLRQAGAQALLELHGPPPDLPADHIVVTLRVAEPPEMPAQALWAGLADAQLLARARLTTSEKRALGPARVARHGVGAAEAVSFYFPRAAQGQPTLAAPTKWAEFTLESLRGDKLKARFKLRDMRTAGQPDY